MAVIYKMGLLQGAYHTVFPTYINVLRKNLKGCKSVLELGCGKSSPLKHVDKTFYSVGVDLHRPAIAQSRKMGIHDRYVASSVLKTKFKNNEFDCVIALDLIEHLRKKDGYRLIKEMERIAKRKIIIFTPNGFLPQGSIEGNEHQEHISGWTWKEMEMLGFSVYGINGWKPLRGERTAIKWKPARIWEAVSILTQPLVYPLPRHAFQIFCVKYLKK